MSYIDEYLETVPSGERALLSQIRQIVHELAPDAEEVKTYGMPGFKYRGKYLVAFGVFKDHMSIFPASAPVVSLADELRSFKTSKGTVQFTLESPLPTGVIKKLIQLRMADIA